MPETERGVYRRAHRGIESARWDRRTQLTASSTDRVAKSWEWSIDASGSREIVAIEESIEPLSAFYFTDRKLGGDRLALDDGVDDHSVSDQT
jgi:hypothetical protein